MNKYLYFKTLKSSIRLLIVTALTFTIFGISMIIAIPSESLGQIFDGIFFASLAIEIPLIYIIITSNKIIANQVQNGEIAYIVASPVSRRTIINTKLAWMITSLLIFFLINIAITLPILSLQEGVSFTIGNYTLKLTGLMLLLFMLSGISIVASAYFNKTSLSFIFGAGIPILFFILSTMAAIKGLEFTKYLTLISLFDVYNIGDTASFSWKWFSEFLAMFMIGTGLYITAGQIFVKKDLPI